MHYEQLDPIQHRLLKVGSGLAGDLQGLSYAFIGANEALALACDYPVVAMKDRESGRFGFAVMLAFLPGRNVYIHQGQWLATLLPMQIARAPFALSQTPDGRLVPAIDMSHPRTHDPDGQRLYADDGAETALLVEAKRRLDDSRADQDRASAFLNAMVAHRLLQPMLIDVDFAGGRDSTRLDGLYTISRPALDALDDADLALLHRDGYLATAYAMIVSQGQFNRLQQLHNAVAASEAGMHAITDLTIGLPSD